jgi:hypothetical protein
LLSVAAGVLASAPAPAYAAVSAAEMQDLPPDHWAYRAIRDLAERYGVMEGFPDRTFRGNKTVTRYELAAALTKVMQRMDQVVKPGTAAPAPRPVAPTAAAVDKATVEKLKAEFKAELAGLETRVEKNETALKALQDSVAKLVKVGGSVRATFADDTLDQGKDRSAPFISTDLTIKFKGTISESTTYDTAIGGTVKASGSGDVPGPMGGGSGPSADTMGIRTARYTTKLGATTINVGRFPMWLVGFGPYSDQPFDTGNYMIGLGALGPDASDLRTGSDVGAAFDTSLGALSFQGGVNSNILITQLGFSAGPVSLKAGVETDHKAITQTVFNTGAPVKTTNNAAVVLDVGGEDSPWGATVQANLTNISLTRAGGGVRGKIGEVGLNLTAMMSSDPGMDVSVLSYGGLISLPSWKIGPVGTPAFSIAALDNYTLLAPSRPDGQPTTGPGGLALGKNAGLSVQVDLTNPFVPNLVAEYNAQAKLIEGIFAPTANVPITSETIIVRSSVSF